MPLRKKRIAESEEQVSAETQKQLDFEAQPESYESSSSLLEEADDYYFPPITGTYLRLSRFIINFIGVFLTPLFLLLMNNPDISGVEYQQGTLFGYEVRSYLMEKYNHTCQYCGGLSGDNCLEVEHIISKHNKGTNKISNLTIACHTCNNDKDNLNLDQWLSALQEIPKPAKLNEQRIKLITSFLEGHPLSHKNYAAWVNSLRYYIINNIDTQDLELSTGGKTSYNRRQLGLPKDHHFDALCVGEVPDEFKYANQPVLYIKAMGRGTRFRGNTNECGIITTKFYNRSKMVFGFQTGDIVKACIPKGKYAGTYIGRITTRKSGSFYLVGAKTVPCVNHKYCKLLQHGNGYNYTCA